MRTKNITPDRSSKPTRVGKIPIQGKSTTVDRRAPETQELKMPDLSDEELLDLYLGLPGKDRDGLFAATARAAEIVGLSQRTIQMWIEIGVLRAILLGGKYKICLRSLRDFLRSKIEQQVL